MRIGENGLAEVQPRPTRLPFMHPLIAHHHHLIPVYPTTTGFSLPYMETPHVSFTKTEPWRLGFGFWLHPALPYTSPVCPIQMRSPIPYMQVLRITASHPDAYSTTTTMHSHTPT